MTSANSRERLDPSWRKALVGAGLLLSKRRLSPRRVRLARRLGDDPAVSPRLLDQAIACVCVKRGLNYEQEMARFKVDPEIELGDSGRSAAQAMP